MWKEVTTGGATDLYKLREYEGYLAEGQRGRLDLNLRFPLSENIRNLLQSRLEQAGVEEVEVSTGSSLLRIQFRKGVPWLGIIVTAILALAILIISWRFFKEVVETVSRPVVIAAVVVGIILVAVVVFVFARKQLPAGGE